MDQSCDLIEGITIERLQLGFKLGCYSDMIKRVPACRFCALVHSVIEDMRHREPRTWAMIPFATGDIVLHGRDDLSSLSVEVWERGEPWTKEVLGKLRIWTFKDSPAAKAGIVPGRPYLSAKSPPAFNLMNYWLGNCIRTHKNCKQKLSELQLGNEEAAILPARVLDIGFRENPHLKLMPTTGQQALYAALSYCWGSIHDLQPLRTVKANLQSSIAFIVEERLPKTIRDAVEVVRRLGIRYLWIDSLCIIQDDEDDWKQQAALMGSIYGNAVCTIAASAAEHCDEGLWSAEKLANNVASFDNSYAVSIPCTLAGHKYGDIYLSRHVETANFDSEVEITRWSQRAWVVQERILSRRIIHFGRSQLYWECQEALFEESSVNPLATKDRLLTKPSMFRRMKGETTWTRRLAAANHDLRTATSLITAFKDKLRYQVGGARDLLYDPQSTLDRLWPRIVLRYNSCDITVNSDKLPAIEGLARSIARLTGQTYFAGLWLEDIARGLYWYHRTQESRQNGTNAPSWSWAGWRGMVNMGSFMAELDTGRPRAADSTYTTASEGLSSELELFAHYWPAHTQHSDQPRLEGLDREVPWVSSGILIFPPFDTPVIHYLDRSRCIRVDVFLDTSESSLTGYICLDDYEYFPHEPSNPQNIVCIVMYTETVRHLERDEHAFCHYILVVKESARRGKFERLGIGLVVSLTDLVPSGLLSGRRAPTSTITLV